jgi:hypothetical protein
MTDAVSCHRTEQRHSSVGFRVLVSRPTSRIPAAVLATRSRAVAAIDAVVSANNRPRTDCSFG